MSLLYLQAYTAILVNSFNLQSKRKPQNDHALSLVQYKLF